MGGGVDQTGYSVFTGIFYQCCERYRETREEKCYEETFRDGERVEGLLEFSIINDKFKREHLKLLIRQITNLIQKCQSKLNFEQDLSQKGSAWKE